MGIFAIEIFCWVLPLTEEKGEESLFEISAVSH
jgi:hypothetical protein